MASESTAASLPGRTQHLAEHSPAQPAALPGLQGLREIWVMFLQRAGDTPAPGVGSSTPEHRQGGITNSGRQQSARTKGCAGIGKTGLWRRGWELKTYSGSGRTGQWAAVPWHKWHPHRSCCAGFSGRRQHGTRRRSPVCR